MNFWLKVLGVFGIPIVVSVLFIGGYLFLAYLWQRRVQRRLSAHASVEALQVDNRPQH